MYKPDVNVVENAVSFYYNFPSQVIFENYFQQDPGAVFQSDYIPGYELAISAWYLKRILDAGFNKI